MALDKVFAKCLTKVIGKEAFVVVHFTKSSLTRITLSKEFAECLKHPTKQLCPVVFKAIVTERVVRKVKVDMGRGNKLCFKMIEYTLRFSIKYECIEKSYSCA